MVCPNCNKENVNEYATVCAYCDHELYPKGFKETKTKELEQKQKDDKMNSMIRILVAVILVVIVSIAAIIFIKPINKEDDSQTNNVTTTNSNKNNTNSGANNNSSTFDISNLQTTKQIVAYYNKNANRVKTEAKTVVRNYEKRSADNVQAPIGVKGVTETLIDTYINDDTKSVTYNSHDAIVENFPVPKQNYSSALIENDVESANCVEDGEQIVITISMKPEKNAVVGKGVGAAFDIVESDEIKEKAPSFIKDFSTEYHDCVITATFDKATGRMIAVNYIVKLKLYVTVDTITDVETSMELSFEKDYTITY